MVAWVPILFGSFVGFTNSASHPISACSLVPKKTSIWLTRLAWSSWMFQANSAPRVGNFMHFDIFFQLSEGFTAGRVVLISGGEKRKQGQNEDYYRPSENVHCCDVTIRLQFFCFLFSFFVCWWMMMLIIAIRFSYNSTNELYCMCSYRVFFYIGWSQY